MSPETGPYRWRILGAMSDIEHEKEAIEFAKRFLVKGTHDEVAERLLDVAQENLRQAEHDLAYWTRKHFEDLQEKHSA